MTDVVDADLEFARRLHEELNGPFDVSLLANVEANLVDASLVVLSDDEDDDQAQVELLRARSRSPIPKVEREVNFENQQAITVSLAF